MFQEFQRQTQIYKENIDGSHRHWVVVCVIVLN